MIPTISEYFEKRYKELGINHVDEIDDQDKLIARELIELHVEATLKSAADNAIAKENPEDYGTGKIWVDRNSILKSYPKHLIK
jgi:hypothetical protein